MCSTARDPASLWPRPSRSSGPRTIRRRDAARAPNRVTGHGVCGPESEPPARSGPEPVWGVARVSLRRMARGSPAPWVRSSRVPFRAPPPPFAQDGVHERRAQRREGVDQRHLPDARTEGVEVEQPAAAAYGKRVRDQRRGVAHPGSSRRQQSCAFGTLPASRPGAVQGVADAVAAGYINGCSDGGFRPLGTTTRAQAAPMPALLIVHEAPAAPGSGSAPGAVVLVRVPPPVRPTLASWSPCRRIWRVAACISPDVDLESPRGCSIEGARTIPGV